MSCRQLGTADGKAGHQESDAGDDIVGGSLSLDFRSKNRMPESTTWRSIGGLVNSQVSEIPDANSLFSPGAHVDDQHVVVGSRVVKIFDSIDH